MPTDASQVEHAPLLTDGEIFDIFTMIDSIDGVRYTERKIVFARAIEKAVRERIADEARDAWIPVSERLPDFDAPVWLYESGRGIWVGGRCDDSDGWLWGNCYGDQHLDEGGDWKAIDFEIDDDYQPTHWMPLPDAPAIAQARTAGRGDAG